MRCRLSPDSTAACVDLSPHFRAETDPWSVDDLTTTCAAQLSLPCDRRITSKCDAQALVGSVYHQLREAREAEQRRKMVSSGFSTVPSTSLTEPVGMTPDCWPVVDQALLETAAEARQIPPPGSEREALVQQVSQMVLAAHVKTCGYTRERIDAGFHKYCAQV